MYNKNATNVIFIIICVTQILKLSVVQITLQSNAAVSRGIPRICRGEQRNLANGNAEFVKICRGKLWALVSSMGSIYLFYVTKKHHV